MLKGDRFIWNYWVKESKASLCEFKDKYVFNGKIKGFKQLGSEIFHERKITKKKQVDEWFVEDTVRGVENKPSFQYWHFSKNSLDKLSITCFDGNNQKLEPIIEEKWYSSYYGHKESSIRLSFKTYTNRFCTKISYQK